MNIEQDDPEINTTESEFSDSPLFENTKLGKYSFAATCVDTQNQVIKALFGWSEDSQTANGKGAYAPTSYSYLYATIKIGFDNAVVVLPKVRLDSKLVIGTLKTGQAQSQISGTCYDGYVQYVGFSATDTEATWSQSASAYKKTPIAIVPLAMTAATAGTQKTAADTAQNNVKVVVSPS